VPSGWCAAATAAPGSIPGRGSDPWVVHEPTTATRGRERTTHRHAIPGRAHRQLAAKRRLFMERTDENRQRRRCRCRLFPRLCCPPALVVLGLTSVPAYVLGECEPFTAAERSKKNARMEPVARRARVLGTPLLCPCWPASASSARSPCRRRRFRFPRIELASIRFDSMPRTLLLPVCLNRNCSLRCGTSMCRISENTRRAGRIERARRPAIHQLCTAPVPIGSRWRVSDATHLPVYDTFQERWLFDLHVPSYLGVSRVGPVEREPQSNQDDIIH
jgi:hypothetical protein